MKKTLLIVLLSICAGSFSAQTEKSVSPLPAVVPSIGTKEGATRAVVIGISDYQDEGISDLKYAHKDAIAFAAWLQSPAGGNIPSDRIQLLLNKEATKGKVAMALDWLMEKSREGDRAIIYFSGHGDVEKKVLSQPGYLLCRDAPPVVYMSGGALSVYELQQVVSTLSLANKARVLVITDACRAGELAGAATGGPQQTTASLTSQFSNEMKILSCQSNEYSLESEQWGGGRGAFSFCLEEALYGLADRDRDGQLRLKEVGRYLEDQVPTQTDPQVQNPMVIGDREALLALVDAQVLAQWESDKKRQQAVFSKSDMRGIEALVLANADSSIQEVYRAFLAAVEAGELMKAGEGRKSANECYEVLINEPGIENIHGNLKRHFVAALADEAQQVTIKLLKTDPQVISDAWSRPFVFDHIPAYLERGAEILGEKHFFYKSLRAKQYFFEAKTCLPDKFPGLSPDTVLQMAVQNFEKALQYDSSAAYANVELGFLYYYKLAQVDKATAQAMRALDLTPNWVYAHYLAGNCYRMQNPSRAIFHLERAIELDSTFLLPYQELGFAYYFAGDVGKQTCFREKFIQKAKDCLISTPETMPAYYLTLLGAELWRSGQVEEGLDVLLKSEERSKGQDLAVYQYLGAVYHTLGRTEDAIIAGKRAIELAPNNPDGYLNLADCYKILKQPRQMVALLENSIDKLRVSGNLFPYTLDAYLGEAYQELGREEEAKAQFQKILELLPDPQNNFEINMKGRAHLGLGDLKAMQKTIDEGLQKFPDDLWVYYQAACLYSMAKHEQKSLKWLELSLQKGFSEKHLIMKDFDLEFIRQSTGFKSLMKKYFPDLFKD